MSVFAPLVALIPAVIIRTDRLIVRDLRKAGATSPERAVALGGRPIRRARTRRLANIGALRAVEGGRFYLVEDGWRHYSSARRKRVLIAAAVSLLLVWIGFTLLNGS